MGKEEIVRLGANDYEELLSVLHEVFTEKNGEDTDFKKILPKMCKPDDEHMGKHFAIKRDGKIRASLGIYPLPTNIAGYNLMFSTVGNVATLKSETGKGYMSVLLAEAMRELDRIGADASRLGGKRSRYNRYFYELCGSTYSFDINDFDAFANHKINNKMTFKAIDRNDTELLELGMKLHAKNRFAVVRSTSDVFYDTLIAWENIPYAAYNEKGEAVAIISASKNHKQIAEINAVSFEDYCDTVLSWTRDMSPSFNITAMPHEIDRIRFLSAISSEFIIIPPNQFLIRNWERVVRATLKLKSEFTALPDSEFVIDIKDYGKLCITSHGNVTSCEKTDKNADVSLNKNEAARYLFGPFPSEGTGNPNPILPLPLSWNLQDRV